MTALLTGTVTGRFQDTVPGAESITGKVYFTAEADYLLSDDSIVLPVPVTVNLVDSAFTVDLVATDDPNLNPVDWSYRVTFDISAGGRRVTQEPFSIEVPAGQTTDLSSVTPVASSGGSGMIVGPVGPVGPQGPIGLTGATNTLSVIDTVTGPETAGATGPQGVKGDKGDPGGFTDPIVMATGDDLNNFTVSGNYRMVSSNAFTSLNAPRDNMGGHLRVFRGASTVVTQVFYPLHNTLYKGIYTRNLVTTWTPWTFIPSQRVDQAAGRAVYTWDDVNQRDQMVFGDTGWRDLTPISGTASWIRLRRVGNIVYVWVAGWANGTSNDIIGLPAGFQTGTNSIIGHFGDRAGAPVPININGPSSLIQGAQSATALSCYLTFPTVNSWPTTLPGTAHAGIPNL